MAVNDDGVIRGSIQPGPRRKYEVRNPLGWRDIEAELELERAHEAGWRREVVQAYGQEALDVIDQGDPDAKLADLKNAYAAKLRADRVVGTTQQAQDRADAEFQMLELSGRRAAEERAAQLYAERKAEADGNHVYPEGHTAKLMDKVARMRDLMDGGMDRWDAAMAVQDKHVPADDTGRV